MKKYLVFASALLAVSFSMQSCEDFTDPGDELGAGQVTPGNNSNIQSGRVDSIDYRFEPTVEEFSAAKASLDSSYVLQTIPSGTYCLRGGKIQDGTVYKPASHAYQRQYSLALLFLWLYCMRYLN